MEINLGYTKLDEGILQSSIMAEDPGTFKIWIALLATCKQDGVAHCSSVFLASVCRLPQDDVDKILEKFMSPDPRSRSKENDGRRIKEVDGGYELLSYFDYRDSSLRDAEAERKRLYRQQIKEKKGDSPDTVTESPIVSQDSPDAVPNRPDIIQNHPDSPAYASASSSLSSSSARKKERSPAKDPSVRVHEVNEILREFGLRAATIEYIAALTEEFSDIDWKEELARKVAHLKDHPLKQTANVALQFRNWFVNARKFAAERAQGDRVGGQQPKSAKPLGSKMSILREAQEAKIAEIAERYGPILEAIEAEVPYDPSKMGAVKKDMRMELEKFTNDWMRKNEHIQPGPEDEEEGPL